MENHGKLMEFDFGKALGTLFCERCLRRRQTTSPIYLLPARATGLPENCTTEVVRQILRSIPQLLATKPWPRHDIRAFGYRYILFIWCRIFFQPCLIWAVRLMLLFRCTAVKWWSCQKQTISYQDGLDSSKVPVNFTFYINMPLS